MLNFRNLLPIVALPISLFTLALSAQNITVGGQLTTFPVQVEAKNTGCDGDAPLAFGYSVDDQSYLMLSASPYVVNKSDSSIGMGRHTIHFKSWTIRGICPVVSTSFTVAGTGGAPGSGSGSGNSHSIPSNAIAAANLNSSSRWEWNHDGGTPGTSVGSTYYPVSNPATDRTARVFNVSYANHGGEIYHLSFGNDAKATHFVYDAYVYVADPSQLANLEMDMNQVTANGKTLIIGTQCSSYSGTWEFVRVANGGPHWNSSNIACNPRNWSANTWHHIQIASHHDWSGYTTYDWVNLDGHYSDFENASGPTGLWLGWNVGDLLINFQLDGANQSNGSIQAYIDQMTIYRW